MPHLSGNHIIARSGPRISIDDAPLKMPRRGGNSLLQAIEELRVSPRAHQSVGRPMAG